MNEDRISEQARLLMQAAVQQVVTCGFHAAPGHRIGDEPGTSNLKARYGLLLEALRLYKLDEARRVAMIIASAGADLDAALDGIDAWTENLENSSARAILSAELQLHAVRDREFGQSYWAFMAEQRAIYAELAGQLFVLSKTPPPVSFEDLVGGLMALERSAALDRAINKGGGVSILTTLLRALLRRRDGE